jgi:hypothetical protein
VLLNIMHLSVDISLPHPPHPRCSTRTHQNVSSELEECGVFVCCLHLSRPPSPPPARIKAPPSRPHAPTSPLERQYFRQYLYFCTSKASTFVLVNSHIKAAHPPTHTHPPTHPPTHPSTHQRVSSRNMASFSGFSTYGAQSVNPSVV